MAVKKTSLGRNLNALLGTLSETDNNTSTKQATSSLPVGQLSRGKYQPRSEINPEGLQELANSIRAQGIIQPIVVRSIGQNQYEIIAGERRWRAAQMAGLKVVPVVITQMSDEAAMASALIENIQREDLNPIEQARALQRLLDEFSLTHLQVAQSVGKSRATISNMLRLLTLHHEVRALLEGGSIEMGHARAILALDIERQLNVAKLIVTKAMSVRETEAYVRKLGQPSPTPKASTPSRDFREVEHRIRTLLQVPVKIKSSGEGGKIELTYQNEAELESLLEKL